MPKNKRSSDLLSIVSYTPPKLYTGVEWYVGWYSYDPIKHDLRRKKIKINHIEKKAERKKIANELIIRINEKLRRGWNPWVESSSNKSYSTFIEVCKTIYGENRKG